MGGHRGGRVVPGLRSRIRFVALPSSGDPMALVGSGLSKATPPPIGLAPDGVQEITDTQLVEEGDRAFTILNRRYRFRWEYRDDVRQEIYTALVKARERYRPERGEWRLFAFLNARGAVRDYLRSQIIDGKQWRRKTWNPEAEENGHAVRLVSHDELLYETGVEDSHDHLDDDSILSGLNPRERFILLCLMAGYNESETARMLSVSLSTVHNTLNRLRLGKLRYLNLLHAATARAR